MEVEAVVLTGGSSRRMGADKASLQVNGERSADRMVRLLGEEGYPETILGPGGRSDPNPGAGPLAALASFAATREWIFVASCDIPLFDSRVVEFLREQAGNLDAALPSIGGRLQPLCAIYRSRALTKASTVYESGSRAIMDWVSELNFVSVDEKHFVDAGLNPDCVRGANTPEEWARMTELM